MAISPKTEREKLSSDLTKGDEHFKQTAVLTEAENQIQGKLKMNDFPWIYQRTKVRESTTTVKSGDTGE